MWKVIQQIFVDKPFFWFVTALPFTCIHSNFSNVPSFSIVRFVADVEILKSCFGLEFNEIILYYGQN